MVREQDVRPGLLIAALALCGTVVSLQQSLPLPLLPEFPGLLDTTVEGASWIITATLLTGAAAVPVVSRLADMYGKKRMMLIVLAIVVLGSAVGSLSSSLPLLIVARSMHGVGMALVPVGMAVMRDELRREHLPLGVGLMSATLAIGAGAGLPLGGLIADRFDWHGIFWVTGGMGILVFVMLHFLVAESTVRTGGTFDYAGAVLISLSLAALLIALSKGGEWGWAAPKTWGLILSGVAALSAWVVLSRRVQTPLVDLRTAVRPFVLRVNTSALLTGFAVYANLLVTVQLLRSPAPTGYGQGLDLLHAGLWMIPSAITFGVMAPVSAALTKRLGARVTLLAGALVISGAYVARAFFNAQLFQVVGGAVLVSIGTGMAYAAMPVLIMRAVPPTETASANGLNMLLRSVGSSVASAAVAAVSALGVVQVGSNAFPSLAALATMFWVGSGAGLLTAILTLPMFKVTALAEGNRASDADGRADRPIDSRRRRAGEAIADVPTQRTPRS